MATYIKQADIFGRLGSGIAQGLASQLPQEMERGRLSQGLKQFSENSRNLSPMQQAAALYSIPGVAENPQLVKTIGELAMQQRTADAYQRLTNPYTQQKSARDLPESFLSQMQSKGRPYVEQATRQEELPVEEKRVPSLIKSNPLAKEAEPIQPWNRQQQMQSVKKYLDMGFTLPEAERFSTEDQERELRGSQLERERSSYLSEAQKLGRDELNRQVGLKLQKPMLPDGGFEGITGEMLNDLQQGMNKDLRMHPDMSLEDAADIWSKKALNMSKAATQLNTLKSSLSLLDAFKPGEDNLQKLRSYQKIYKDANNLESFYQNLQSMGLSPLSSSKIAFPLSKSASEFTSSYKRTPIPSGKQPYHTQISIKPPTPEQVNKHINETVEKMRNYLTKDDSILSIADELSKKDPYFDKNLFFESVRENLPLSERQQREVAEGKEDILPHWTDWLIMPWFGKKVYK